MHAEHPERTELARQFARGEFAVFEPLLDVRAQPVVGELCDGVAQQAVFVVQVIGEVEQIQPGKRVLHGSQATR